MIIFKNNKLLIFVIVILTVLICGYWFYKKSYAPAPQEPFTFETPQKRSIYQDVNASGILEIKDTLKMGSLVAGVVKNVFVKENDVVKNGQPLIEIELIKDDTDIKKAESELTKAKEELAYQENYFKRQQQLYLAGQTSKDAFQKITKDYQKFVEDVRLAQNEVKRNKLEFKNTTIYAPDDGIVTVINTPKGSPVNNDFNNVLIEVAHDPTVMSAKLDIDESDIGQVKADKPVEITINAYPDFIYTSKIESVGYAPKGEGTNIFYKATVAMDNKNDTLRPGMSVNARIHIAEAKDALSTNCQAFYINPNSVKKMADFLGYKVKTVNESELKKIKQKQVDENIKMVWIAGDKEFIQKIVKTGITDNLYYEIKSGLSLSDKVLTDILEADQMEEFYKKMFQGPL